MIAHQVARIIAEFVVFLEMTDEQDLHPDNAMKMLESLSLEVEAFEKGFLRELIDAFPVVAKEYEGEAEELVRKIPRYFELEEALAADDPVRLAELEALRDAEDD